MKLQPHYLVIFVLWKLTNESLVLGSSVRLFQQRRRKRGRSTSPLFHHDIMKSPPPMCVITCLLCTLTQPPAIFDLSYTTCCQSLRPATAPPLSDVRHRPTGPPWGPQTKHTTEETSPTPSDLSLSLPPPSSPTSPLDLDSKPLTQQAQGEFGSCLIFTASPSGCWTHRQL